MQKNSVNKVILIGNLGQDPESRFTPQGTAVTSFSVATNESWKSQSGEIKEHTEWHRIEMFGKRAETANEYMRKGNTVYIEGRLKTDEWEDKETGQNAEQQKFSVIISQCWDAVEITKARAEASQVRLRQTKTTIFRFK